MTPQRIGGSLPILSRRSLLRGAAVAGGTALAGHPVPWQPQPLAAAQTSPRLSMVWWGESEAVGIQAWINDTLAQFTAQTGIPVDSQLVEIDDVVDGFTRAAEAGAVPDVQF